MPTPVTSVESNSSQSVDYWKAGARRPRPGGWICTTCSVWSEPREGGSLLEQALKNQLSAASKKQGRNASPMRLIVDAQSVKNADTAEHKGDDAGKKVSGIKRPVAVDTPGLPHAVAVTTAEVTDSLINKRATSCRTKI